MNTAVTTQQDNEALIDVLLNSLYPNASRDSALMVISYCQHAGYDVMQKPVHIVPMWDSGAGRMRDVIMPGINLYRVNSARSGFYGGMSEPEFGPDVTEVIGGVNITYPAWCKVSAYRLTPDGVKCEFPAIERWKENYAVKGGKEKSIAPNTMWAKRPYGQLAKCAEAQALRKAFPESCPAHTAEEMEGKDFNEQVDENTSRGRQQPRQSDILPEYPAERFAANLPKWQDKIEAGKSKAADIIATISGEYILNKEQKDAIMAIKPKPKEEPAQAAETVTGGAQ